MSNRYKGAIISATPPTTTGGESGVASGAWTLEQQMQLIAAGLWPSQPLPKYIEDVFSTYLYTGTGATQTITNGIDLSTKGGLVWIKARNDTSNHALTDTVRGTNAQLNSNDSGTGTTATSVVTAFNTTGFNLGTAAVSNRNGYDFASWTFREQPKFFDVVTYTGTGSVQNIAHNLGSVPGCIIIKVTSTANNWAVYHQYLGNNKYLSLDLTTAATTTSSSWNLTTPTSTNFTVGTSGDVNGSGQTFVAYLFAHDAGGFGLTGTDNVISCGGFTGDSSGSIINLGYEPQWLLMKRTDSATYGDWILVDNMRGWPAGPGIVTEKYLQANTTAAEASNYWSVGLTSTGFSCWPVNGATYIYIAIRRGPMAVPTTGTSVFSPNTYTGTGATLSVSGLLFPPDMVIPKWRSNGGSGYSTRPGALYDKLRGAQQELAPTSTAAESTQSTGLTSFNQSGFTIGTSSVINSSPDPYISWNFRRAPGFFDEVCYTGTGSATTFSHNLAAVPELMIIKSRSRTAENWPTYAAPVFVPGAGYTTGRLNDSIDFQLNNALFNNARPTASVFSVGTDTSVNFSGSTYVAYLFATCAGVSKVGSYTGTGTTKQIDCGFTAGARFVLIKRTDSTGDWYVYDSARGITSGNDPYLFLNSSAAEVTNTNYVDTDSTGFKVTAAAPAGLNASGGTYIFLAIA